MSDHLKHPQVTGQAIVYVEAMPPINIRTVSAEIKLLYKRFRSSIAKPLARPAVTSALMTTLPGMFIQTGGLPSSRRLCSRQPPACGYLQR